MNDYLVLKQNGSKFKLDYCSDNKDLVQERKELLGEKAIIAETKKILNNEMYYSDEIFELSKSLSKYRFYPIFKVTLTTSVKLGIDSVDVMIISRTINEFVDRYPDMDEDITKSLMERTIYNSDLYLLSNELDSVKFSIKEAKYKGVDSWLPLSNVSYSSYFEDDDTNEYLIESLSDYIDRHSINHYSSPEIEINDEDEFMEVPSSEVEKYCDGIFFNSKLSDYPVLPAYTDPKWKDKVTMYKSYGKMVTSAL